MGEIGVLMNRSRPSSELPFAVNPKYAWHSTHTPPEVAARSRVYALTCVFHSGAVSSTRAAFRRFCVVVVSPER
ncbi:hypothetical protein ABT126_42930 [Streptomyces sp. NPDC002012]|uniref:hypothetical protein n=1 Tax=Streptomyces sp. NPDC002012 TaxID=3154532 RepID=UPI00331D88A4